MTLIQADSDPILLIPGNIEMAILRAVLYADVFDYPLTAAEIHRYLAGEAVSPEAVRAALAASEWLKERVVQVDDFYLLPGRTELVNLRLNRARHARQLWPAARWYGSVLAQLPFVRMVAVTGALAMNNVTPGDDVDFVLVTAPGRVWLARAFAILIVRLARRLGVNLCPNYVLAETALAQERRDFFIAHELAQMMPLAGQALYWQMRSTNGWAAEFLPNAAGMPQPESDQGPHGFGRLVQRAIEWALSGRLGDGLERWERGRKIARFQAQLNQTGSAAVLDESQVKGHFNDYGWKAMAAYAERCRQHQIPV